MTIATPSTPTRPLSSAYRNLMNFRARQGSTAERGAVTGGVEMYRQVWTRIRVGVWGTSQAPTPVPDRANSSIRLGSYFGRRSHPARHSLGAPSLLPPPPVLTKPIHTS